ncbi:MAG: septum formation initiator family protein [Candidatus Colwellbacteria bacterium]|nr:septum formation initiator family protein [Candidatus Colwellbacteria bacterium]
MTIIQPNKNKSLSRIIFVLGGILVLTASFYVFTYANSVGLNQDIKVSEKNLERLKVENAELKNDLFALTDSRRLDELAKEKNLIYDKNPQWAIASHF